MRSRTIAIVLAAGAAVALLGRSVMRPPTPAPSVHVPAAVDAGAPATIHVYDDGNPADDRWVVFHDAAGNVLSSMKTNKEGVASGAGSMITVAYGTSIKHIVTIVGVEPNDNLVVGEEEDEGGPETTVCTAQLLLPSKHPKAARHVVSLGVGTTEAEPSKPLAMPVLKRYLAGGKFAAFAEATDAAGEPVAFSHGWFSGCESNDGGMKDTALARLPAWSTTYRSFEVDATSRTASGTLTADLAILGAGGDRFERGRRSAALGEHTTLKFPVPGPLGSRAAYKLVVAQDGGRSVIEQERTSMPEKLSIDLDKELLPRVTDVALDGTAPRPSVRWRVTGPSQADAVVVRLTWPATGEHIWTFVLPPNAPGRIAVPALPNELAQWRPDQRPIKPAVAILDASFFAGFADVKRKGLEGLEDPPEAETTVLRYSSFGDLDF